MRTRKALTLMELVVVLSVLAALSAVLVPLFSSTISDAQEVATRQSLLQIRDALVEYWQDGKLVALDGVTTVATESDRLNIDWLFANPVTDDSLADFDFNSRIGWRGPYLAAATGGTAISPEMIDAWNNAITIQDVSPTAALRDVRIVSGGPNGFIDLPNATATSALSPADVGDDVYVALQLR